MDKYLDYVIKPMNIMSIGWSLLCGLLTCMAVDLIGEFFIGIQGFLFLLACLVGVDWITGVRASKVRAMRKAKEEGTEVGRILVSGKMRKTVDKLISYLLLVVLSQVVVVVFFGWGVGSPLPYVVSAYICYTEYISILENVEEVTGLKGRKGIIGYLKGNLKIED